MKIKITLLLLSISIASFCKTWTVVNVNSTFSPSTLTITEGDSVLFVLASPHEAREVSQSTWNSNGSTAWSSGFQTPTTGGLVLPAKLTVGTHFYVCTPHAQGGMKGQIIVQSAVSTMENSVASVSLYPNPVSDVMTMKTNRNLIGSSYFMYDLTGRQVLNGKLLSETTGVDLSQLKDGVYFLQVGTEGKQTFKVIKN